MTMKMWITVRMDDGDIVRATVHASEEYRHPHEDYAEDNPNPTVHVSRELTNPPAILEALQAAMDVLREQLTSASRIEAMRAEVRAAERVADDLELEPGDHRIAVGGGIAPTGTDPAAPPETGA